MENPNLFSAFFSILNRRPLRQRNSHKILLSEKWNFESNVTRKSQIPKDAK
jgi:hypothetical protein